MTITINTDNSKIENLDDLKEKLEKMKGMELPPFVKHIPDYAKIKEQCEPLMSYKNVIIIGNGGSVKSSDAFYNAQPFDKKFIFLTTMEPDYLDYLAKTYKTEDTIVIPVSKSGNTTGVLESLMFFINKGYNIAVITSPQGTLFDIAQKMGYPVIEHPPVGGRYSARTACALAPAHIMGYNLEELEAGFIEMYEKCSPDVFVEDNPALKLASVMYKLEQEGKVDVFLPVYSASLSAFLPIIVQLMHESFGKEGKGQSYFGDMAPESQHHTNQRFFGGRKNIAGLFVNVLNQDDKESAVTVPEEIKEIVLREGTLQSISGVHYEKALEFEFRGTYEDALNNNIPICLVSVDKVSHRTLGEFMALWQYYAVYSSMLRDVNPYDQPQVEGSKKISFRLREEYKKNN